MVDAKPAKPSVEAEGLFTQVGGKPQPMLEAERLYAMATLVQDLRQAGRSRDLAETFWHHLQDRELLENDQLAEGLRQMGQGGSRSWQEIKAEWNSRNSEPVTGKD
ncbi:hypothetical protein [Streptosporangium sp. NPDC048865]|uniref:hypothetical protein n=1 Tax=Streptosporangium sp. NPDC048865 TaxID=3155766 RepID=UPI00341D6142